MSEKLLLKIGYYDIFEVKTLTSTKYRVDSGKTIYVSRFKKYIPNKYRDTKEFTSLEKAKDYVKLKLVIKKQTKAKIKKSLYLVLIKEEQTGNIFVKVGITSKRFILKRFSKAYGYEGYIVENILRRIDSIDGEKYETKILDTINKKRTINKYRPSLKSFSGYSECFNFSHLDEIITIFDKLTIGC